MRSHELTHRDKPFSCSRCGKTFLHLSKLNLHRHLHRHQRLYSCFAPRCKRTYKWPQDLLRHIKKHLNIILKCKLCTYTTHENDFLDNIPIYILVNCPSDVENVVLSTSNMPCNAIDMNKNAL